jgi:hypothetical protein
LQADPGTFAFTNIRDLHPAMVVRCAVAWKTGIDTDMDGSGNTKQGTKNGHMLLMRRSADMINVDGSAAAQSQVWACFF